MADYANRSDKSVHESRSRSRQARIRCNDDNEEDRRRCHRGGNPRLSDASADDAAARDCGSYVLGMAYPSTSGARTMATSEAELKKAIKKGDLQTVRQIIGNGLRVDSELPGKVTALEFSLAQEKREIAWELLRQGAMPRKKKGDNLLLDVPKFRDTELLRCLVERGADVHGPDQNGYSPFLMAVAAGFYDGMYFLLERGVNPLARTSDGLSALQLAEKTRRFCEELLPKCEEGEEAAELFRAQLTDLDRIERHLESILSADQVQALRADPPQAPEPSTFWDLNDLVEFRLEVSPFPFTSHTKSQLMGRLGREGKKWVDHFSSDGRILFRVSGGKDESVWTPLTCMGQDKSRKPSPGAPTWVAFTGEAQLPAGQTTIEIRIESDWDIFKSVQLSGWTIHVNK